MKQPGTPSVLVLQRTDLKHMEPLACASPLKDQGPATDVVASGSRLYIHRGGGLDPWIMFADPPYQEGTEGIRRKGSCRRMNFH